MSSAPPERYARVIVDVGPAHLDRPFDYRIGGPGVPPDHPVDVGTRVRVSFNGRPRTAWVVAVTDEPATDPDRIKPIDRVEGPAVWFDDEDIRVWRWVADRFAGTLSGVIRHALPPRVVRVETEAAGWGRPGAPPPLAERPAVTWAGMDAQSVLAAVAAPDGSSHHLRTPLSPLSGEGPALADLVARCVAAGRQAVVVAPSPAPGPVDDVVAVMGSAGVDLRGDHDDADRYRAFLRLRRGEISVVVGERSVALLPLPALGLLVVVDEANPAYKERRNPRHHVREAVLGRARIGRVVAVLTSSVLSATARRHATRGHLNLIRADRATERAASPRVRVVDRSALPPSARRSRMTAPVARHIDAVVADDGRVIVLAAAKGSGTSLACVRCRSRRECPTCGAGVAERAADHTDAVTWTCGSCGWEGPPHPCLDCAASETFPLRAGAKRLARELARTHPRAEIRHMEGFDQPGPTTRPAIAVMTRGSIVDRPRWLTDERGVTTPADLLVIADPDVLIGRPDVEAAEDAVRLWMAASRLARTVVIQTAEPGHPAVQAVVRQDADGFWDGEEPRRAVLGFPPVGSLVRFTSLPVEQAAQIRHDVPGTLLGPDPTGVALLKSEDLHATLRALRPHRIEWARQDIRIRVDVDPVNVGA